MKNLVNAFNNRLDTLNDWINTLDNRLKEIPSEVYRGRKYEGKK